MDLGTLLARGGKVYFIGIKGTGMCALAELFHDSGLDISGSDRSEVFYTDAILSELGIPYYENFDSAHVPRDARLAVHSAAYNAETNPEMAEVLRLGIPLVKYTDALGAYSALFDSTGIAGVHGKTTTTAMIGALFRAAALPARVLAGSAVSAFGGRSTLSLGNKYFAAETCEYRRHFLAFYPRRIVLTSVESDHQDYFPEYEDIRDAFLEYADRLPPGGILVYCADDGGAAEVADTIRRRRSDLAFLPYGFSAPGPFRIERYAAADERTRFTLAAFPGTEFKLRVPGKHCVTDAAAALALTGILIGEERRGGPPAAGTDPAGVNSWTAEQTRLAAEALEAFAGSRRRSEILGEAAGILFMDDYGHHPTAVKATLRGLKEFYPRRRLVVSFMSHTYTRTAALLDDFAASLLPADKVFLHKIYGSAREVYSGGVTGAVLFEKTKELFGNSGRKNCVYYVEEPEAAAGELKALLKPGDLFITMGAGDNWRLGKNLFLSYRGNAL
ncbi:MAG: UDP-N-acetylmuramate--L-alanine ligase [Spirochaetaceae bacterium]|jgi:UDP-N-acetylmuramate--alanine ligase|nr:UDP-N-acetylmuramate--L-alanine ligase [Spirochaetaceae bacterium]